MLRAHQVKTRHVGPVDLEIAAGECLCLSGPSGSGKSLLLRALADLDPHDGELFLDGHEAGSMAPTEWRRRVGLLPAEAQWWAEWVGDHFAVRDPVLLERLGFGEDVWGWEVARLSSGEKQRLSLARLLANRPQALLLDEPTANLDGDNGARVEEIIADYRHTTGAPVLWVSHDPQQRRRVANRAAHIAEGRVVEVAES